jgi:hypothetical protein
VGHPEAWSRVTTPRVYAKAREIDKRGSLNAFLKSVTVKISGTRKRNISALQRQYPLNPVSRTAETFVRRFGADVVNGLVLMQGKDGQTYTILREQSRTPLSHRRRRGKPGGRDFTMSESFGGSLEKRKGKVESVTTNVAHEVAEELGIPVRDARGRKTFQTITLSKEMAISPDRSAGAATLVVLKPKQPVRVNNRAIAEASSGEIAETGARALDRVPISRAIRYLQTGQVVDGRAALLLLQSAYQLQIPLKQSLSRWPGSRERQRRAKDFDPARRDVPNDAYSRVQLRKPKDPQWRGRTLSLISRGFRISTRDGRGKVDRFEHKAAVAADQVSEMPVVRDARGRVYVGLVPTVSAGILARQTPAVADKVANPKGNMTDPVQLRGIVRDVNRYHRDVKRNGGNLGVMPIYRSAVADAHKTLSSLGLNATGKVTNLGQYNASAGENGFHINLMTREFRLKQGASVSQINRNGAVQLVPLDKAIQHAQKHPNQVDQMTQVQLYLLALKEGQGFKFASN